jgi:hypothetical protein
MSSPFPGPTPPYNNPPIEPQYFKPSQFFISAITLGVLTTITTTVPMNYVIGQQVRLLIPNGFGSRQLNEQTGFVLSIPGPTQIVIDLNSQNSDPFINNATLTTKAQILAIGDENSGSISHHGRINYFTTIPGAFRNISPL